MEWLPEDLCGSEGVVGLLWNQLTYALACRHCGSSCLQSPGNLIILFLFMVWQIQRWWQLGRWRQLQPWYSGDKMRGKGLPLLYHVAFLDRLWKQKSEEEEEAFLDPLKTRSLLKEAPIGEQVTTAPSQPFYNSEGLHKAAGTLEQGLMQTPNPPRSFPTFQILTNLPVRHTTSGSCSQERKSQFFWGLPSLHSESLEATFLSSGGLSPLKLSVSTSVFFNKLPFPPRSPVLLLPRYGFPTPLPTQEAHTTEDLERMASDPQQLPSPSSPPVPSLPLHPNPFSMDHKTVLSGTEANTQWLTQPREIPWVSRDQALHQQPNFQRTRPSKLFNSSEVWWKVPWDPNSLSVSLAENPSSLLGALTRSETPWQTMGQKEDPKIPEPAMAATSLTQASLPECQGVSPLGGPSGSEALWETMRQREKPQIPEPAVLVPCQSVAPLIEPQGTSTLGVPPADKTQWGSTGHKESTQAFQPPLPALCQPPDPLSDAQEINPEGGPSATKDFRGSLGHRVNPMASGSPVSAFCPSPHPLPELLGGRLLGESSGYEPQWRYRENSTKPWALEPPAFDLNPGLHGTRSTCVPSESETPRKGMESKENLWVSADPVSPPSFPSASLESIGTDVQAVLSDSNALRRAIRQRDNLWTSESPAPGHSLSLAPVLEHHRISPVGGLTESETAWKGTDHSRNSWASESPSLAFSTPPVLVLDSLRAMGVPFESEARCGDLGGRKDSRTSELPDCSLPQDPHGANSLGVQPDSKPIWGDVEQKEICWVPAYPVWSPSPLPNSMSKSHTSEPIGDKCDYKPEEETVKHTQNCRTTELLAATPRFSALLPDPHIDLEFVRRNMQYLRGILQDPNPPAVYPLQPIPWPAAQGGLLTRANAETPSSRGKAIPKVPTCSGIQAWHWSTELKLRLEKLQQSTASRSPSQSFSSSLTLSSTTQATRKLSSCPPQQTHPPSLWPHSSSCHPPKGQSTVTQPIQVPYCYHSHFSFQPQTLKSGRAEQGSRKEQRKKAKTVYQISPQESCVHMEAGENCLGQEEPSNPAVPASGKREDKASALPSAKNRASPRKPKEGDYGEADASLGSSTVTEESHPAQARRLAENPVGRLSRSQHSNQCSPHTAFSPQPHSKYVSSQGQRGARLGTPHILAPRHCKLLRSGKHRPVLPLRKTLQEVNRRKIYTRAQLRLGSCYWSWA
uniref:SPATA31 domain-containing protein n=1 Tax=Capra hircus TaxID=9925 RepID=A0A8C2QVS2_CAPHI